MMVGSRRRFAAGWATGTLAALLVLGSGVAALGQVSAAAVLAMPTRESIETKMGQAEEAMGLDAETKAKVLERYRSALRILEETAATVADGERYDREIRTIAERTEALRRETAQAAKKPAFVSVERKSLTEIDAERGSREANLTALKQALKEVETERKRRTERKAEIRREKATAEATRSELRRQAEVPLAPGESVALIEARQIEARLKLLKFEKALTAHDYELKLYEAEDEAGTLRLREDQRGAELAREQAAVERLTKVVNDLRLKEADRQIEQAQTQALVAHPLLKPLAESNALDAEKVRWLSAEIERIERVTAGIKQTSDEQQRKYDDIREKVEDVGLTRPIGLMLRERRAQFPDMRKIDDDHREREALIDEARLLAWKYEQAYKELQDAHGYVRSAAADRAEAALAPEQLVELERMAGELLAKRRELLTELQTVSRKYFESLVNLDTVDQQYVEASRGYLRFINERILWTRSADPLTAELVAGDLYSKPAAGGGDSRPAGPVSGDWLLAPANWRGVLAALAKDPFEHPFAFWPTLVAVVAMLYVRLRIRPRLRALGGNASKRGFLRYSPTAQAAVLTLMSAVTAPSILMFLSWRLAEAVDPTRFVPSVGAALEACAAVLFPVDLLREACRHMGLAEAHFGWPTRAVQHLRRALTWMKTLGLPVTFLTVVGHYAAPMSGGLPAERVLFVLGMALAALTVHRLLARKSDLVIAFRSEQPQNVFSRYVPLWYVIAVALPLAFAGLSAAGYHYSATQVAYRLLWTLWLASGAVLIRAMAVRWIVLSRRRLMLDQAYQRRAAEEAQGGDTPPVAEGADIGKTAAQTRKLVDIVMLGFAATGLAMIWADTLPAIGLLDRPLWVMAADQAAGTEPAAAPAVSVGTAPASGAAPAVAPKPSREAAGEPVTTLDLAVAIGIALFIFYASRNLPGLIEMSILNRIPVDHATRYAATRLASYAIVVVGMLMASNRLGLRWQNVQWLVAALTVGLGFGLQEVFANFVSGLIILFERPVRVGDVVTISDVTGVVSRIRMRATTITNWDRKEFIVPNKEFITGRVLNWTLSDAVNRVTVNVGIAYGADTDLAREILLRVCREHPLVLKDPAPSATFEGFGDSTLNMVLRCFLPSLELRSDVVHELHTRVDREFRAAGIDIAFPQRDLHIRSVQGVVLPLPGVAQAAPAPVLANVERAAG